MDVGSRSPFGGFLDDVPKAVYVLAHVAMFAVGIGLWVYARNTAFPHPGALLLYVMSQVIFFSFFANRITLKMAVLVEQMLMLIMVCAIVIGAF